MHGDIFFDPLPRFNLAAPRSGAKHARGTIEVGAQQSLWSADVAPVVGGHVTIYWRASRAEVGKQIPSKIGDTGRLDTAQEGLCDAIEFRSLPALDRATHSLAFQRSRLYVRHSQVLPHRKLAHHPPHGVRPS